MRLEHIKNITFNQMETNKEMNTTYAAAAADVDEVDCEKNNIPSTFNQNWLMNMTHYKL